MNDTETQEIRANTKDEWDDIEETDNDIENEDEEESIKYDINYYPSDMSLSEYKRKWENESLLIPAFQRNYVWTKREASKLIESFLLGLPVPGVFLYKRKSDKKLLVVDGQQRILSFIYFFQGMFKEKLFRLQNVKSDWNGKSFSELSDSDKLELEDSILRATIIQQLDPQDDTSIYHVFERLNTGGRKLNPMEVRRCVFEGPFLHKLEVLNNDENWRKMIGRNEVDIRYRDVEWILRSLAFALNTENYEKPMKGFLTDFVRLNIQLENDSLKQTVERFGAICEKTYSLLGEKCFHLRNRLNYSVLDCIMSNLLKKKPDEIPEDLSERFDRLKNEEEFINSVTYNTSDANEVNTRLAMAESFLFGE